MSTESLIGNIDSVLAGNGFLVVTGWVFDQLERTVPSEINLTLWDGTQTRITHFHFRQDLQDAGFGACAFQTCLVTQSPPVDGAVIELATQAGQSRIMRGITAPIIRPFQSIGRLEHVSLSGAWGWVYDPGLWLQSSSLILRFDDRLEMPIPVKVMRQDLPFDESDKLPLGFGAPLSYILPRIRAIVPNFYPLDGGKHKYEILTSGRVISTLEIDIKTDFIGKVENVSRGAFVGWASAPQSPETPVEIEILSEGEVLSSAIADRPRSDLARLKISETAGGFRIPLTRLLREQSATLTARPFGSSRLLKGAAKAQLPSRPAGSDWLETLSFATPLPAVTIIIPIYNAASELKTCLESVTRWTSGNASLLLIDDASPDPSIKEVLDLYKGNPRTKIYRNKKNLGFTKNCNRAVSLVKDGDVVLLNSDTIVGPRWLENLQFAAYSRPTHGTATPMSNNAGFFSFPESSIENAILGGSAVSAARLSAQHSAGLLPTVPTGHGFCLYIKRDCLTQTGMFDAEAFPRGYGEENDFCLRASRLGWTHVLDDRTYVVHCGSASFQNERSPRLIASRQFLDDRYPEYTPLIEGLKDDPLIHSVRGRVSTAGAGTSSPRPRILYVVSTETGGTPQTNRDLMSSLTDRYEPWLMRCDRSTIYLYNDSNGWSEPVSSHELGQPIRLANHRSIQYNGIVAGLLVKHAIEIVHIRHLAWHSLDLPNVAKRLGIPVVLSFHDFYTVCPTVKLLDERKQFCAGRCTPGEGVCVAELWPLETVPHLKHRFIHTWRASMLKAIEACDTYVTTSDSAANILKDIFPIVAKKGIDIIPHGRSFPALQTLAAPPPNDDVARIVIPGNISEAKGSRLIKRLSEIAGNKFELHVLGDPGIIQAADNVVLHGRYAREEFQERLAAIAPRFGLVLSIWPETWSHTLTELWASGLPVLALDTGAVSQRIRHHGGGWLLPISAEPEQLLEKIEAILAAGKDYREKCKQIAAWQAGFGSLYDTITMASYYDGLYRSTMNRRLALSRASQFPVIFPMGSFDPSIEDDDSAIKFRNHADRKAVFRPIADVKGLSQLSGIPQHAILIGTLSRKDLNVVINHATQHGIPLIHESDLLNERPTTLAEYDDLLLWHLQEHVPRRQSEAV